MNQNYQRPIITITCDVEYQNRTIGPELQFVFPQTPQHQAAFLSFRIYVSVVPTQSLLIILGGENKTIVKNIEIENIRRFEVLKELNHCSKPDEHLLSHIQIMLSQLSHFNRKQRRSAPFVYFFLYQEHLLRQIQNKIPPNQRKRSQFILPKGNMKETVQDQKQKKNENQNQKNPSHGFIQAEQKNPCLDDSQHYYELKKSLIFDAEEQQNNLQINPSQQQSEEQSSLILTLTEHNDFCDLSNVVFNINNSFNLVRVNQELFQSQGKLHPDIDHSTHFAKWVWVCNLQEADQFYEAIQSENYQIHDDQCYRFTKTRQNQDELYIAIIHEEEQHQKYIFQRISIFSEESSRAKDQSYAQSMDLIYLMNSVPLITLSNQENCIFLLVDSKDQWEEYQNRQLEQQQSINAKSNSQSYSFLISNQISSKYSASIIDFDSLDDTLSMMLRGLFEDYQSSFSAGQLFNETSDERPAISRSFSNDSDSRISGTRQSSNQSPSFLANYSFHQE